MQQRLEMHWQTKWQRQQPAILDWYWGQVALTVDPEAFVIGGGVSRAGQFLVDKIDKYYQNYTVISKNKGIITLAKLGNDAGIYGAARMVLD